jgi:DNA modification methylase
MSVRIVTGDCRTELAKLADDSVNCVVTSPPYFGLRDYGVDGQIGLERSVQEHITILRDVFREVRRVLRKDGTCWVNYGDAYASDDKWGGSSGGKHVKELHGKSGIGRNKRETGLKSKDLIGLPWRLAFALQDDGWWLRSDIIWAKPNPMPESATDRPTRAHEYIFLLTKSARYTYDADAIRTPLAAKTFTTFGTEHRTQGNDAMGSVKSDNWGSSVKVRKPKVKVPGGWDRGDGAHGSIHRDGRGEPAYQEAELAGANARTVWTISTSGYPEAHFATFPPELAERCIKAGCPEGGTVLDPFGGAGTTGLVADRLQRNAILIELNPAYAEMAKRRIEKDAALFASVEMVA